MKKTPVLLKLDQEQVTHLKKQSNQSEYVRNLIQNDAHRPTRQKYVFKMIGEMVLLDINRMPETELISRLSLMLSEAIVGIDVLSQVQERIDK